MEKTITFYEESLVSPNAKIHPSARIHPSAIIEEDVSIGPNTTIGAQSYLKGPLVIGENNQISHHVMIGVDPEHKLKPGIGCITIGNGNIIREFSVIQRGIGDLDTQIQNDCFIMAYGYIAHDCLLESNVILCARVSLSGHCHILQSAILGISCSLHQFSTVGSHAFIGMGSIVVKDVPPFCIVMGNPAYFEKFNLHPLKQLDIKIEDLEIQNAQLQSPHLYVKDCINAFHKHSRRKILQLAPSKINN